MVFQNPVQYPFKYAFVIPRKRSGGNTCTLSVKGMDKARLAFESSYAPSGMLRHRVLTTILRATRQGSIGERSFAFSLITVLSEIRVIDCVKMRSFALAETGCAFHATLIHPKMGKQTVGRLLQDVRISLFRISSIVFCHQFSVFLLLETWCKLERVFHSFR